MKEILNESVKLNNNINERFNNMDKRFDRLEGRFDRWESKLIKTQK